MAFTPRNLIHCTQYSTYFKSMLLPKRGHWFTISIMCAQLFLFTKLLWWLTVSFVYVFLEDFWLLCRLILHTYLFNYDSWPRKSSDRSLRFLSNRFCLFGKYWKTNNKRMFVYYLPSQQIYNRLKCFNK